MTVPRQSKGERLRDFDLAPLSRIEPRRVVRARRDEIDQLFLALALVFNDIKSLTWFEYQLRYGELEDPSETTPYNGQRSGFKVQLMRLRAAIVHELLTLLREKQRVVRGVEVSAIVEGINQRARRDWDTLVRMAVGEVEDSGFARALERIRHVTFHYYNPTALADGFEKFFLKDDPREESAAAMYSDGATMEATRFYYADAAALGAVRDQAAQAGAGDFEDELGRTLSRVNQALKAVVAEFLRSRSSGQGHRG